MNAELPPPLPPETRTVGQLVAETIRFYQANFWAVLPLGLALAAINQANAGLSVGAQVLIVAATSPLMTAAFVRASALVLRAPWSWTALAVGSLVYLPVPLLLRLYLLPAPAWLAFIGLAVPAAVVERLGFRAALERGRRLGTVDYVHALGGVATLAIVFGLTRFLLALLLQGQADVTVRSAMFLADLVLSPILFVGAALLYTDQRARIGREGSTERRGADVRAPPAPERE
jgi:hypothetical protein